MKKLPLFKCILLLSYISLASVSAAIITPSLPTIITSFHLSDAAGNHLVSIFLLGYVAGQLVYGPLSNRYGRLNALRAGLLLNLLGLTGSLVAVYLMNFDALLITRFITALGAASGLCCTLLLIKELSSETQAKRLNAYALVSFTLGVGLSVWIGGMLTEYGHWYDSFYVLLAQGGLLYLLSFLFEEPLKQPLKLSFKSVLVSYKRALFNPRLVAYSLIVGLPTTFSYSYSAVAPMYSHQVLGLSAEMYGNFNGLTMIGMLLSGFVGASCQRLFGMKRTLWFGVSAMSLCTALLFLMANSTEPHGLIFFILCSGFFLIAGLLFPTGSHFAMESADDKACASSILSFVNMGSASLAVIACGLLPYALLTNLSIVMASAIVIASLMVVLARSFGLR